MSLQTCVECGAQAARLLGGLCPACFVRRQRLLEAPAILDVEVCSHCDARHVGAHWVDPDEGVSLEEVREEAVRAALQVHAEVRDAELLVTEREQDPRTFPVEVTLQGQVEGVPLQDRRDVLVRMRRAVCDRCSRMFGGFYAAILQLRASDRDVTRREIELAHKVIGDELDRQRATGNREAFLTKSGPVPGGFDYYFGDIEGTRAVARLVGERLHASVVETAKLSGRREGEDMFRVTFLVRIRLYAGGDFATMGRQVVQVLNVDRGRALVIDLATHRRDKVEEGRLQRLAGPEALREAVLVSQDAKHIQVLDPVTLRTVDLVRPEGYSTSGPSVQVFPYEDGLFLPAVPAPGSPRPPKPG